MTVIKCMMCSRRDVPPVLLLLVVIVLLFVSLLQIFIAYNGHYPSARHLQLELRQMDLNLYSLMLQNVPSIEHHQRMLHVKRDARRAAEIIRRASVIGGAKSPSASKSPTVLPDCSFVPPDLVGTSHVSLQNISEEDVRARAGTAVASGGRWHPGGCFSRHHVAIIIPFRQRLLHLQLLLANLHPILQRQQLNYRVFLVEQAANYTFNKARMMNIGFVEAMKLENFHCVVFHDVDLVPEDDRNMYSCPYLPRHMSVAIDEMGYKLLYQELVGGVLSMKTQHFQRVNGYSNLYWGWGAEDDDMAFRIMHVGLKITRPPEAIARYKMLQHPKQKPSDWRKRTKLLLSGTRRFQFDGLNSLQYRLVSIRNMPLYTHILADIGKPPKGFR